MNIKQAKSIWERAVNVGVTQSDDFANRKKIRFLNAVFLIFSPVLLLFTIKDIWFWNFSKVALYFMHWVLLSLGYFFNSQQKSQRAFYCLLLSTAPFIYHHIWLAEEQGTIPFFLVLLAMLSVYIVENRILRIIIFIVFNAIFLFIRYEQITSLPFNDSLFFASAMYFVVLYFALRFFETDHAAYQKIIEGKNKLLESLNDEIKNQHSALADSNGKLRELDQFKTRLFANISHDFRTPLTLMQGYIHRIVTNKDDYLTTRSKEDLESLSSNALTLTEMTNEIQDLILLEEGKLELKLQRVEMTSYLRRQVLMFNSMAEMAGVKLKYESELDVLSVNIDSIHWTVYI